MFDFSEPDAARGWAPIDDRVMGGVSRSRWRHAPAGHAVFEGDVSLAQGGVGYLQYWLGIPAELVSLHILGASLVWLATARLWVVAHRPDLEREDLERPDLERAGAHEDTVTA